MKIKIRQFHLIFLLLIISFRITCLFWNENTLGNVNFKEISCRGYLVNLQWANNPISQLNQINRADFGFEDKKRHSRVKKKAPKNDNPSKLRSMPRKTKPKINRKNGVNRFYSA